MFCGNNLFRREFIEFLIINKAKVTISLRNMSIFLSKRRRKMGCIFKTFCLLLILNNMDLRKLVSYCFWKMLLFLPSIHIGFPIPTIYGNPDFIIKFH